LPKLSSMSSKQLVFLLSLFGYAVCSSGQNIATFTSVSPSLQSTDFVFPSSHAFQKIIEHADPVTGGTMKDNLDFTGFVPISGSSTSGRLSINHELTPGGITAMDVSFNPTTQLWSKTNITALDFTPVNGTARNCSGGITPWGNVITCEEAAFSTTDSNNDGYYDLGWHVETNPTTKTVVQKLWALGNGPKENIVIHPNRRTAYFGNDATTGYLYKFVANTVDNLSSGNLYVYTGPKTGNGTWVQVPNGSQLERNTTMAQCGTLGGTVFNGVEDVEIGPDGKIYVAVKNEDKVYRLLDSDPISGITTSQMETYVGGMSYNITHSGGTTLIPWGTGNDNLVFDGQGNLWVCQDGSNNYIWVVMNGHTQAVPNVKLFGIPPAGSEPTGITFTPDYKYLFMSFQHPNLANNVDYQIGAGGESVAFDRDIAIVIALDQDLGCPLQGQSCTDNNPSTFNDAIGHDCNCVGTPSSATNTFSVNASSNDAEQNIAATTVSVTSSDLELITDGANAQIVGIRFTNINIPPNAVINEAYLQFTTDVTSTITTNLQIFGEKNIVSAPFEAVNNNISARTKTTQSVPWTVPSWTIAGESGNNQKTPNLVSIVQEVVSQPNWESSNPMTFIVEGTGIRVATSYDGSAAQAPRLILSYQNPLSSDVGNVGISTTSPLSKLHVNQGDIYVESIGNGMILRSPDGSCWRMTVSNTGVVSSVAVDCP
jgi:uncharacterized protein